MRLRSLLRRSQADQELDEELQIHIEQRIALEMEKGHTPTEARRIAMHAMDGLERRKEECRDQRGLQWFDTLMRDLRYSVRTLRRTPGFTIAAILALAIGIGANSAVFSVVHSVILRPLPYQDPDRLAWIRDGLTQYPGPDSGRWAACMADYLHWQKRARSFDLLAAWANRNYNLTGDGMEAKHITGFAVTSRFFDVLGRNQTLAGRTFAAGEDQPGQTSTAVISERLWEQRYGRDPAVAGRIVHLNGRPFTIIGVMPSSFTFLTAATDVWTILPLSPPNRRGPFFMRGIARLRAAVTWEQANREMEALAIEVEHADPKGLEKVRYPVTPLTEEVVGEARPMLMMLTGAVALVMLIAIFNVANLMLARATSRQREMSIRLSLGAGAKQLARQLMTESLVLAALAGLLGIGLAYGGVRILRSLAPEGLPRIEEIGLHPLALAFTLAISVVSGVLFGLAPAWFVLKNGTRTMMESGRANTEGRGSGRLRGGLVVAEIALTIILLSGGALLVRSLVLLGQVHTGFHTPPDRLLTVQLTPTGAAYAGQRQIGAYWDQVLEKVRNLAGVEAAALAITLPPDRVAFADGFEIPGKTDPKEGGPVVPVPWVTSDYFETMGIRVLRGRVFDRRDRIGSPGVVVISESLARRYFPNGEDPVGRQLKHGGPTINNPYKQIIGVVADVKYEGLATVQHSPVYYEAAEQDPSRPMWLVARTAGPARQWLGSVQQAVRAIDPNVPLVSPGSMQEAMAESIALARFRSLLMAAFAISALALAAVGIYGVLAYSVERRTQEMGVRMALGATASDVLRLVIGQGGEFLLLGVAAGTIGALLLTRSLEKMLFGVTAYDPIALGGAVLLLAVAALAACVIPALRASRVDPLVALRHE